ncbi:glycosyltransferase family 1 protein [Thiohalocapsa marina]|uniref:Glycosyltransferase family 1 protein n=1 Tax=Thiohalocapsa marina TaxID=424902 RepID=A0A5M8FNC6_9GAMM|nr:glycosyltransferase family 1 protein [Thiohalocapsa marina]KAA6185500.1 glycosyltransferase family 1 protein [Thiohalocapsa marina]
MPRELSCPAVEGRRRLAIAVVTETYPPEINGVANTMRQLADGLVARGHSVSVIRPRQGVERVVAGPGPEAEQLLVPGLPIPGYRGLRFGLPVYRRLRRRWRRCRPDVVYVATQGPLGHAALHAACTLDIAVLTGFHTQFHQYSRHYGFGLLMRPIMRALRQFHNRSDGTLVPTRTLEHRLHDDGFRNVRVFGRGVDTQLFSPARRCAALRRSWGCDEDSVVALYVGRIAAEKNIGLAVRAFAAITQRQPGTRCVFVGDGPALEAVRREHPEHVFAGARVGAELARHYASADCFIFPSLTETFGNVVTEAMASGLAVVAFDDAAAHEYVSSWCNGVVVPMGCDQAFVDAAVAVAADGHRLRRLGRAARATAETLSWDRVIESVERRLLEAIRHHAGSGGKHESMAAAAE